jgi:methylated-DNA-protein-cysteine methyltransferase-like protein
MKPDARRGRGHAVVYRAVLRIPRGCVATYGQIAALIDRPGRARQIGYALHALPEGADVPWHRVVNARGEVSLPGAAGERQRARLRAEGVRFDARGRIDLRVHGWRPASAGSARRSGAVGARRRRPV